jgi:phosphatidate cytidylyltransferase
LSSLQNPKSKIQNLQGGSETRTRIAVGLVLILLVAAVLGLDRYLGAPIYPCLLVFLLVLATLSCLELHALLAELPYPPLWLLLLGCGCVLLGNWPAHLDWTGQPPQPWRDLAWIFAAVVLAGLLYEMAVFREPGSAVVRSALLVWVVGYLGLLPCFLAQLRWWPPVSDAGGPDTRGEAALALTIFVAKGADIGAYFTGRLIGRRRLSPVISPKKTWEGLAGGLVLSMLIAVGLNRLMTRLMTSDFEAALFGIVVGGAGVLGDLAESLIKRDRKRKDASHVVPGFGGVLDVVDSVLFAAPVAYWWLRAV